MPRTWTDKEITEIIAKEIKAYRDDCRDRQRTFSHTELAECIYGVLNEHSLIEDTP